MTYIVSPAYIVCHIHSDKNIMDEETGDSFIEIQSNWLKKIGIDKYLTTNKIDKKKMCAYFTQITSSLRPITDIQLSC